MPAKLEELFPFEYHGCGYFRLKGVDKGVKAPILHGMEAVRFLHEVITTGRSPAEVLRTFKDKSYESA